MSTLLTAAQYSPISGLLTAGGPAGASGGGESPSSPAFGSPDAPFLAGGTSGSESPHSPAFGDPNVPTIPGVNGGVAPPAPPGTIGGIGAYTPDWAALISSDPGLLEQEGALAADRASSAAQRDAAIQQAFIQFGGGFDPSALAKQLGMSEADVAQALGPDAQRLAQENTDAGLSTRARMDAANQQAIMKIKAELNARGMLNSGQTGYDFNQENLGYRQNVSDATQKLLGFLQQYQQGYLAAEQQRQAQLSQDYNDAATRVGQENQSMPGVTATLDHIDASGNPVYIGPDGTLYNADGSAYTAPSAGGTGGESTADTSQTPLQRALSHLPASSGTGGAALHPAVPS